MKYTKFQSPSATAEKTFQLGRLPSSAEETRRLAPGSTAQDIPQAGAIARHHEEPDNATLLDPESWPTSASTTHTRLLPAQEELRRFGPGVPPQAMDAWHRTPPRRKRRRWPLLSLLTVLAVPAFLLWQWSTTPITVTALTVRTDPAGITCNGTALITGTLETEGAGGAIQYHWIRSDGTDSGMLTVDVPSGHRTTEVELRWAFKGRGTMNATATLETVLSTTNSAAVSFTYTCR
ncbi:hypothetical protein [Streptomyces sp. NPDC053431]|uniref:hypothetical protein n=1 Tax=Streptomyces sp. NPDC053431 TaxID=3365703 RepID=UPI0037D51502